MAHAAKIRQYIQDNLLYGDTVALDDSASLLDAGIIDSTGAMELVAFLETQFGIRIDDRDLVPENLDSIAAMDAFVSRKLEPQIASPSALAKSV
jgi:acyl carrier protein